MLTLCLRTSALLMTFLVAFLLGHVRLNSQERQPAYVKLPKAWGSVKAFSGETIILEDANGTIRIFEMRRSPSSGVYLGHWHVAEISRN